MFGEDKGVSGGEEEYVQSHWEFLFSIEQSLWRIWQNSAHKRETWKVSIFFLNGISTFVGYLIPNPSL